MVVGALLSGPSENIEGESGSDTELRGSRSVGWKVEVVIATRCWLR